MLLICLALIDAAQRDTRAASAGLISETTQFIRATPCGQTIQYKIGRIDTRFGVDSQRVMAAASQAAGLWNAAADARAVEYNTAGSVTVELIYDARQSLRQHYDDYAAIIKREEAQAELIEEEATSLQSQMDAANATVTAERNDFAIRRDNYNARVDRLNDIGGGTRGQVRALDQTKVQLDRQRSDLNEKVDDLDKLNASRSELVKEHNALVDQINEAVASANRDFGKDIVAGLYIKSGKRATIEIFAFTDQTELVAILAHEFGHALGLRHSSEPDSIMGKLRKSDGIIVDSSTLLAHLSPGDIAALADVCGRSTPKGAPFTSVPVQIPGKNGSLIEKVHIPV